MSFCNTLTHTHCLPPHTHMWSMRPASGQVPWLVEGLFLLQLSPKKEQALKLQFSLKICKAGRGLAKMMVLYPREWTWTTGRWFLWGRIKWFLSRVGDKRSLSCESVVPQGTRFSCPCNIKTWQGGHRSTSIHQAPQKSHPGHAGCLDALDMEDNEGGSNQPDSRPTHSSLGGCPRTSLVIPALYLYLMTYSSLLNAIS